VGRLARKGRATSEVAFFDRTSEEAAMEKERRKKKKKRVLALEISIKCRGPS
jgi:hypothetical protein